MKHHYVCILLLVVVSACQHRQDHTAQSLPDSSISQASVIQSTSESPGPSPNNFLIIPGIQVGAVTANATEASLIRLLGVEHVSRDTIYVAEGNFEIGTTLFKNTANQAQILWADNRHFARPETVLLRPARDAENRLIAGSNPQWITDKGLVLGMTLRQVEKINGRPFALYGFGWDYGGLSSGWKGGALDQKDGKTYIGLGFGVPESQAASQEKLYESLMGDQEFPSNNPAMQKLNPIVENLTISFK
ncbi:hypothetical protein [Fibrella arboris]|uniref:hypothetical protein n=1 Tax=Fibrella arboris TaxID=3242486 RepID=UPI003520BD69